ncbi:MAG TPA: cytochrome c biogenesis protein CcsA [Flavobacteriales bacterium]|nr:cytochrome c biogenesis protein CcsA [Flavobacteriales bacterium]
MDIQYIGEHTYWGTIGHLFISLSFAAAILSAVSYWFAQTSPNDSAAWKKLGRLGFRLHSLGVVGIIGVMFFILFNHYFEFHYVWQHSNKAMQMKYILSCFWEGQEGSFLLWTFWNMVLGNILIRISRDWEFSTMTIVALVQVFLASMLLGVYVGDVHIGSNPFILLREHPDFVGLPFIQMPDYLAKLDGRGLNPLLQNYWMTIHPPTLFLGFSLTLFPFAYAIAGIWRKQYREWIAPALPWTFFGISILGTGILMGGAWAYEALSFGGFWAWDPVENASLVPWLTLVAGGHVMLINKSKGQSVMTAIFMVFITFILILYSTFLTRSGVLGESSVHAFTDLGMTGQLLIYLFFFIWLPSAITLPHGTFRTIWYTVSVGLLLVSFFFGFMKLVTAIFLLIAIGIMIRQVTKALPKDEEEESISSREFWMFVGALVLLISAFQITFSTSTPVINKFLAGNLAGFFGWLNGIFSSDLFTKLADANMASPKDASLHYNAWQIPFAVIVAVLMAVGQFLKYKKTPMADFYKKILLPFSLAFVLTAVIGLWMEIDKPLLLLLLFASLFATLANFHYLFVVLKFKMAKAGSSVAHVGFGLVLMGALISAGKKEFISQNKSSFDLGKDFPNQENILLARNDTVQMGEFDVSYRGDSIDGINIYYNVDYYKKNAAGQPELAFRLSPLIQTNPRMGNVAEPATKHYLGRDIFTHITYAKLEENTKKKDSEWKEPQDYQLHLGDTMFTSNSLVILDNIQKDIPLTTSPMLQAGDLPVGAQLRVLNVNSKTLNALPLYVLRGNTTFAIDDEVEASGLKFSFWKIDPETETFHIRVSEKVSNTNDFIIMKAIIFPGINILWIGSLLMAIGTGMAVWDRIKFSGRKRAQA